MVACEIENIGDFGDQATLFYEYHDRWDKCGPLIHEFNVWLMGPCFDGDGWKADIKGEDVCSGQGSTAPMAICRAIVAAKLGDEVEIPDELVG